jgi:ABC-type branched-subunit amino acid transport system ATPase component
MAEQMPRVGPTGDGSSPERSPVLQVENLQAGYQDLTILRGVSIQVGEGERVLIFGPNGSGKSTLLKSVMGIARSTAGSVRYRGRELTGLPTHRIVSSGVSFVPQTDNVFADLTVEENLQVGGVRAGGQAAQRRDRIYDLLPRLAERRRVQAGSLSGGERQLVAMGRALMLDPSVLLLDEPSAGLSPAMVDQTFEHVMTINRQSGIAILLVEQNVLKGMEIAQRGYLLETGRVRLSGTAEDLRTSQAVQHAYLGGGADTESA